MSRLGPGENPASRVCRTHAPAPLHVAEALPVVRRGPGTFRATAARRPFLVSGTQRECGFEQAVVCLCLLVAVACGGDSSPTAPTPTPEPTPTPTPTPTPPPPPSPRPGAIAYGRVQDAESGAGIQGATVIVEDNWARFTEVGRSVTAADGTYEITGIRGGPRNSDRLLRWIPTSEWRDRNHAETEKIPR